MRLIKDALAVIAIFILAVIFGLIGTVYAAEADLPVTARLITDCVRQAEQGQTPIAQICAERGECCDYEPVTEIEFSEWTSFTDTDETAARLNRIEPAGGER